MIFFSFNTRCDYVIPCIFDYVKCVIPYFCWHFVRNVCHCHKNLMLLVLLLPLIFLQNSCAKYSGRLKSFEIVSKTLFQILRLVFVAFHCIKELVIDLSNSHEVHVVEWMEVFQIVFKSRGNCPYSRWNGKLGSGGFFYLVVGIRQVLLTNAKNNIM